MSLKYVLMCFPPYRLPFLPASAASSPENKWIVIVDRASLLLINALSGLYKVQEQSWRLLELHSLKIVSSGIIWVSLQEVEPVLCPTVPSNLKSSVPLLKRWPSFGIQN